MAYSDDSDVFGIDVNSSTGGGLRFAFDAQYDEEREEYVVDTSRELYPDARRDRGAVVYGTNAEWSYEDLEDVEDFVDRLWMPEDQDLYLEVYGTDAGEPVRDAVYTHDEPDAELERQYLPTLTVEDGVQQEEKRRTPVEVKKTSPGSGGVYEMGIPVTTGEEFPFVFNVWQKTPVTERRTELDNSYRTELMQGLIDDRLDLFDDDELLVYTEETPSMALTWAMQRQLPMENAAEYSRNVRGILTEHCPSVQGWYSDQTDGTSIDVIEDPEPEQEAFLEYVESELVPRTRATGVDFELAYISEDTDDGQTHATYPGDETVYLNAFADDWDEPTPRRIGTVLHELGHHETNPDEDGHGPDWYHAVEELGGEVIQDLQDDLWEEGW